MLQLYYKQLSSNNTPNSKQYKNYHNIDSRVGGGGIDMLYMCVFCYSYTLD